MLKRLSYIFMILAVILTVSHNITAHDHHVVREAEHDEHDDDGDDDHSAHTFFSYGHLEDSFVNSKADLVIDHESQPVVFIEIFVPNIKCAEIIVNDLPASNDPPIVQKGHSSQRSLRAPPVSLS